MAELTLPKSLHGVELVKSVRTPAELRYQYTAGAATTRFLTGLAQKKILAERCPKCGKVYVPPRGSCPSDGIPTTDQVDLPHVGTVTSFCIVNVQFYGQAMEVPYTLNRASEHASRSRCVIEGHEISSVPRGRTLRGEVSDG